MTTRTFFFLAAVLGAIAVAFGAFAAHGLKSWLEPSMLANWQTGVRYQFYHVFALLAAGWLADRTRNNRSARWSGWLFLMGVLLFSGSLYVMALTGWRWLGVITPFGGVAFVVGWLLLANAAREIG